MPSSEALARRYREAETISGFPLLVERYDDTTGLGTLVWSASYRAWQARMEGPHAVDAPLGQRRGAGPLLVTGKSSR